MSPCAPIRPAPWMSWRTRNPPCRYGQACRRLRMVYRSRPPPCVCCVVHGDPHVANKYRLVPVRHAFLRGPDHRLRRFPRYTLGVYAFVWYGGSGIGHVPLPASAMAASIAALIFLLRVDALA